jgi:hypothetical protein
VEGWSDRRSLGVGRVPDASSPEVVGFLLGGYSAPDLVRPDMEHRASPRRIHASVVEASHGAAGRRRLQ